MEETVKVRFKRISAGDTQKPEIPLYATAGAAGADLYACLDQKMVVRPGERVRVPTGIAIELPGPQIAAFVFARSGLADKKGLTLSNGVGVIDSDFRGEIKVLMINLGQEDVTISNGDRIAQIAFIPVCRTAFYEVEDLGDTARGEGGFGSTGV
ncbi:MULTISPECIES: dUTP diphosphatase [Dehalobacter]|jgi:dUTP pyrophosphatase|uniref:Deoxyuridine 5'-triphosphate nucleotidohydrolase n=2 Tax=Dehalobacter restrictus TaxID=55583 RepID=A0A857DH53_9FIRM|nr:MULTISPECIES: dUTP diphosphatase [Dehalobacter]AHF09634.1 deoxyuridine 5'-triphosphate nucleotidohydrolase [Dehalobacter restrictus DSM 9455]MCG1026537.1 dUTP diphosphatase [Dehalobacter sp.]MDJ0304326.1 dUTP diphosphatase [Dehalobacter sp.]OCZ54972.1 deoxyuridine 5'-triphosphate nucleotidohydrolase [Dehalobacter sp. TeCB1]QHA00227.1 dUTP diphosphatase [Dehalobacter restrictus]